MPHENFFFPNLIDNEIKFKFILRKYFTKIHEKLFSKKKNQTVEI